MKGCHPWLSLSDDGWIFLQHPRIPPFEVACFHL
jgi:hypothetical protein